MDRFEVYNELMKEINKLNLHSSMDRFEGLSVFRFNCNKPLFTFQYG